MARVREREEESVEYESNHAHYRQSGYCKKCICGNNYGYLHHYALDKLQSLKLRRLLRYFIELGVLTWLYYALGDKFPETFYAEVEINTILHRLIFIIV